ncbi:hypothetical protein [Rhizobium azibense]|uniref:Uncharacterized protein n=1 Tax=Rhizobium azibense TaxID=1136135 RepID=A0A4R3RI89_9HYPH|nr:hypothetical protein [Rhizobium azibense]TCU35428.1 hypothetical protein EV129_10918 [Rhizobium azibense]
MTESLRVSDHAVLRYLERAHGLDVEVVRRHIASRCATGAELRALSVVVEKVKFVLQEGAVVTVLKSRALAFPKGGRDE